MTAQAYWQRAMQRAKTEHLCAYKVGPDLFMVRSRQYAPGTHHLVRLAHGRIIDCSECPGWAHRHRTKSDGTMQGPCAHAAAVYSRLLREHKKERAA